MPRSAGSLRTLFLVLVAAMAGMMLGFGAFSLASAVGGRQVQDLGDLVKLDPAKVTVTPGPTQTPTPTPAATPTLNPQPEQVLPAVPSPAQDDDTDDDADADDDTDDDADDD
jgi:hypothetical protein